MKTALIIAGGAAAYVIWDIYRFTFFRSRSRLSTLLLDKKGHGEDYYKRRDEAADKLRKVPCERHELRSGRGEKLCGWYYPCREGEHSMRIAFIVHGYHSEHLETAGMLYELYHSRGFDVFTCDNTASGESGGQFFGYDVFESEDALLWLEYLRRCFGNNIQFALHGFSLGGASVLKMSDRVPDCVRFIVSDSGFIDAREILRAQSGPLYPLLHLMHRLIAHCELDDSDVRENVRRSRVPILVVHGEGDKTVPFDMAPRILALCPEGSDSLFTPDIKHIETLHYNRQAYEKSLDAFIERYM